MKFTCWLTSFVSRQNFNTTISPWSCGTGRMVYTPKYSQFKAFPPRELECVTLKCQIKSVTPIWCSHKPGQVNPKIFPSFHVGPPHLYTWVKVCNA